MECQTYCTSYSFNLKTLYHVFHGKYKTTMESDVVHIEVQNYDKRCDAFFFPYGTAILWNFSVDEAQELLAEIDPVEYTPLEKKEHECYEYQYGDKASFHDDILTLPDDDVLTKTAFSHCLAQSIKLRAFESMIQKIFEATHYLPEHLAKHGKIPLSRRQIRKMMGSIFNERNAINLRLNILNTPKFFWENPEYEHIYLTMASEMDIETRTSALNQQLDVLHDLFEMLGNELDFQHSNRLEWAIVLLIIVEVLLLLLHDVLNLI